MMNMTRRITAALGAVIAAAALALTVSPTPAVASAAENFKRPAVVENFKKGPAENFKKIGPFNGVPVRAMKAGETCPDESGVLCIWQHANKGGRFLEVTSYYVRGGGWSLAGSWWNNRISAAQNETGKTVELIGNVDCRRENLGGYVLRMVDERYIPNMANVGTGYANDHISCIDW